MTVSGALSGCETRLEALRELEDGSPIAPASVRVLERPGRGVGDRCHHSPGAQPPDPAHVRPGRADGTAAAAGAGGRGVPGGPAGGEVAAPDRGGTGSAGRISAGFPVSFSCAFYEFCVS